MFTPGGPTSRARTVSNEENRDPGNEDSIWYRKMTYGTNAQYQSSVKGAPSIVKMAPKDGAKPSSPSKLEKGFTVGMKEYIISAGFEHKPLEAPLIDIAPKSKIPEPTATQYKPSKLVKVVSGGLNEYVSEFEHKVHDFKAEPDKFDTLLMQDLL